MFIITFIYIPLNYLTNNFIKTNHVLLIKGPCWWFKTKELPKDHDPRIFLPYYIFFSIFLHAHVWALLVFPCSVLVHLPQLL